MFNVFKWFQCPIGFTVLSCAVCPSLSGFSTGRIKEGMFEYGEINGWMTPQAGTELCERDVKCAGFTFNSVLIQDEIFELYFFSYVREIEMVPDSPLNWDWTSYRVSRDFVIFPYLLDGLENPVKLNISVDLVASSELAERMCFSMDRCAGLAQSAAGETVVLEAVLFWAKERAGRWTTLVSLHTGKHQVYGHNALNINRCCPEGPGVREINLSNKVIKNEIETINCDISKEDFMSKYVRRRVPVILENCLNKSWFPNPRNNPDQKFAGQNFDEILERLFNRGNDTSTRVSRPMLRRKLIDVMRKTNFKINYSQAELLNRETVTSQENLTSAPTFTHSTTPNDAGQTYKDMLEMRRAGIIRAFLKLSNLRSELDCYQEYRVPGTDRLSEGHEKCLVLDGFWKPSPMPDDLYAFTKYDNDLAWIIMSAQNTGSQMHIDPDYMGAWNLLLTGRKWWAIHPYEARVEDFTCDTKCSGEGWTHPSNSFPWFDHILPQLQNKKYYGKAVAEFVQEPGDVLFLPQGMPHSIFNMDDNVALTENCLYPDGLAKLVKAMALNMIKQYVPNWNESFGYKVLYNHHTTPSDRRRMRETYAHITRYISRYNNVC